MYYIVSRRLDYKDGETIKTVLAITQNLMLAKKQGTEWMYKYNHYWTKHQNKLICQKIKNSWKIKPLKPGKQDPLVYVEISKADGKLDKTHFGIRP